MRWGGGGRRRDQGQREERGNEGIKSCEDGGKERGKKRGRAE